MASFLEIGSPRPVPPYFLVVDPSACWKGVKICSCLFSAIPIPLSFILKWISSRLPELPSISIESRISPCSVNLAALPKRLIRICWTLVESPFTWEGTLFSIWQTSSMGLSPIPGRIISSTSYASSSREKLIDSITSSPASILERSRMSLIRVSNVSLLFETVCI